MTEIADNIFQTLVLFICCILAAGQAIRTRKRKWIFLDLFYWLCFLGDAFWLLYLLLIRETPYYIYISDLSWYASFLFLSMLMNSMREQKNGPRIHAAAWLGPAFTLAMGIFYMVTTGEILGELLLMFSMGLVFFETINAFADTKHVRSSNRRPLCFLVFAFCILEYALLTVSLNWMGDSFLNPYFWIDIANTVLLLHFLPAVRKAEAA